jgi:hypothetical protein
MRNNKGAAWVWIIFILGAAGLGFLVFRDFMVKKQKNELAQRAQYVNELLGELRVNMMLCRMVLQESDLKDDTFAVNVKALKRFMIYMSQDQEIFTVGEHAAERINELKKRFDIKNILQVDGFQAYIYPKDAPDVMDMFTNLEWLMVKAAKNNYDLNF